MRHNFFTRLLTASSTTSHISALRLASRCGSCSLLLASLKLWHLLALVLNLMHIRLYLVSLSRELVKILLVLLINKCDFDCKLVLVTSTHISNLISVLENLLRLNVFVLSILEELGKYLFFLLT